MRARIHRGARFDKLQFVAAAATCDLVSASDKLKFVGHSNFNLSSGSSHESLAENNDKLKFVGHFV